MRNAKPRPGSADVSPSLPADALAGVTHTARRGLHADSPVWRQTRQSRKRGRTDSDFQTEAGPHSLGAGSTASLCSWFICQATGKLRTRQSQEEDRAAEASTEEVVEQ